MRRIIKSTEAEWTPDEKLWCGIQQFDPRRGRISGHIVAVLLGLAVAAMFVGLGL